MCCGCMSHVPRSRYLCAQVIVPALVAVLNTASLPLDAVHDATVLLRGLAVRSEGHVTASPKVGHGDSCVCLGVDAR